MRSPIKLKDTLLSHLDETDNLLLTANLEELQDTSFSDDSFVFENTPFYKTKMEIEESKKVPKKLIPSATPKATLHKKVNTKIPVNLHLTLPKTVKKEDNPIKPTGRAVRKLTSIIKKREPQKSPLKIKALNNTISESRPQTSRRKYVAQPSLNATMKPTNETPQDSKTKNISDKHRRLATHTAISRPAKTELNTTTATQPNSTKNSTRPRTASRKYEEIKTEFRSVLAARNARKNIELPSPNTREITSIKEESFENKERVASPSRLSTTTRPTTVVKKAEVRMNKYKGIYNVNCLSAKAPPEIMQEIIQSLNGYKLKYRKTHEYALNCQRANLKMELEIMQMEEADFLHIIRFKRIGGDVKEYKEASAQLLDAMRL